MVSSGMRTVAVVFNVALFSFAVLVLAANQQLRRIALSADCLRFPNGDFLQLAAFSAPISLVGAYAAFKDTPSLGVFAYGLSLSLVSMAFNNILGIGTDDPGVSYALRRRGYERPEIWSGYFVCLHDHGYFQAITETNESFGKLVAAEQVMRDLRKIALLNGVFSYFICIPYFLVSANMSP